MKNNKPTLGLKSQLANILGSPSLKESPRSPNLDAFSQKPKVALPELSKQSISKRFDIRSPTDELSAMLATASSIQREAVLKSNSLSQVSQVVMTEPNMVQYNTTYQENFSQIVLTENSDTPYSERMHPFKHSAKASMTEFEFNKTMAFPNSAHQKSMSISGLKSFQAGSVFSASQMHSRNVSLSKNLNEEKMGSPERIILEKIDPSELERKKNKPKEVSQFDPNKPFSSPRDSNVTSPRAKNVTLKSINLPKESTPTVGSSINNAPLSRKRVEKVADLYRKAVVPEKLEKKKASINSTQNNKTSGKLSFKPSLSIKTDLDSEIKDLPPPLKTEPNHPTNFKTSPKDFASPYKRKMQQQQQQQQSLYKTPKQLESITFPTMKENKNEVVYPSISTPETSKQEQEPPQDDLNNELKPITMKNLEFVTRRPSALEISPIPSINVSPIASNTNIREWEFPSSQVNFPMVDTNTMTTITPIPIMQKTTTPEIIPPSLSPAKKVINILYDANLKTDLSPVTERNEGLSMGTLSGSERHLSSQNHLNDQGSTKQATLKQVPAGSLEKINSLAEGLLLTKNKKPQQDEVLQIPIGTLHRIDLASYDESTPANENNSPQRAEENESTASPVSPSKKVKRKSKRHKSDAATDIVRKKEKKLTPNTTPPDQSQSQASSESNNDVKNVPVNTNRPSLFHRNSQLKTSDQEINATESRPSLQSPSSIDTINRRKSSIMAIANLNILEQMHSLSKSPHLSAAEAKRKMSLIRSFIKEEELSNNSSSFERRQSDSYSQERLSVTSLRRGSFSSIQGHELVGKRLSGVSLKNQKNMLNLPEADPLAPSPTNSQLSSGEEMIQKVSVYKSAMLKSRSYRHVFSSAKPKTAVNFNTSNTEKSEFKSKFTFDKKKTDAPRYKKSTDLLLSTANLFGTKVAEEGFLSKLHFVALGGIGGNSKEEMTQNASPLFAGRSMLTDVKDIEKQIMDFSSLLTRYDETSPVASAHGLKKESSSRRLTKSNTPVKRETRFTINIVPPSTIPEEPSELPSEQTKMDNTQTPSHTPSHINNQQQDSPPTSPEKKTHYEYVLQKDSRRLADLEPDFSPFENLEDFGWKDFNIEIYLGDVAESNPSLLWNFNSYFSSDKVLLNFLKYFEQLFIKKHPFLISLYDDKLKRNETEILANHTAPASMLVARDDPVLVPEKYEPNITGRQDFGENERIFHEALNHYFANLSSQAIKFERQGSASNYIEDSDNYGDCNLVNVNLALLPRQPQSLNIEKGRTFTKQAIIIIFSQEVFDTVFKQNYMTFEDYLAFDGMHGPVDNLRNSAYIMAKMLDSTSQQNLDFISKILFKIYGQVLRGNFEHNYFILEFDRTKITPQEIKEDIKNRIRTFKQRKTLKASKSTGEVQLALIQQNLVTPKTVTHSDSPTQLSFLKNKPVSLSYRGKAPGPSILKPTATLPNEDSTTIPNREISSLISVRINKTLTKNFESNNNHNATENLQTTKYTDERTQTIEDSKSKPESLTGLTRFPGYTDLKRIETIQDKGEGPSNQSFRNYEAYQKIATAQSDFLQIPSKTFISDEQNSQGQGQSQSHTQGHRLSISKEKETGEQQSSTVRKFKNLVTQGLMGKSDISKSDGNGGKSLIEAMRIAKASRIPSITLTKEGESRVSEETIQQTMTVKKNPLNKEKSRRMIFQMKKPTPTLENNKEEDNKSSILKQHEKDKAVMRISGNLNNRKHSYDPLHRFFNLVKENRVSELEEFFVHHPLAWIDCYDEEGNNALIIAAQSGFTDMIVSLIAKGINLNGQNRDKNTALHLAFAYSHYKVTDILIRAGASQSLLNSNGRSPWELAS